MSHKFVSCYIYTAHTHHIRCLFWSESLSSWVQNQKDRYTIKASMVRSTGWEGSIYSHVFEHNQLLLAAHLLLQDLGCQVGTEAASVLHRQFCAEEVWRSPRQPDGWYNSQIGNCPYVLRYFYLSVQCSYLQLISANKMLLITSYSVKPNSHSQWVKNQWIARVLILSLQHPYITIALELCMQKQLCQLPETKAELLDTTENMEGQGSYVSRIRRS